MNTYMCRFCNGAEVLVEAWTPADAKAIAEGNAARSGYPGLSVTSSESVSDEEEDAA